MPELTRREVLRLGAAGAAVGGVSALGFDVVVTLSMRYGGTGRPEHLYPWPS